MVRFKASLSDARSWRSAIGPPCGFAGMLLGSNRTARLADPGTPADLRRSAASHSLL